MVVGREVGRREEGRKVDSFFNKKKSVTKKKPGHEVPKLGSR